MCFVRFLPRVFWPEEVYNISAKLILTLTLIYSTWLKEAKLTPFVAEHQHS